MRLKWPIVCCTGIATLLSLVFVEAASAAYLYPWDDGNPSVTDPLGDPTVHNSAQDIVAAWAAFDGSFIYFRLDLVAAPTALPPPGQYAGVYGIFIDDGPGGADGVEWDFVPDALSGIDGIVDSHFDPVVDPNTDWWGNHYHVWNGTDFDGGTLVAYQQTENAGRTLEWQIPLAAVNPGFTWWAGTWDMGSCNATYDLTLPVPEPAAFVLLGLAPLMRRRRS